jgi:RHS repeat-associated protein
MGARRYGPALGQFLQEDAFDSALDDVGLSVDALTNNRYALAAGNPISYVEADGHMPMYESGTAAKADNEARGAVARGEASPGGSTGPVTDASSGGGYPTLSAGSSSASSSSGAEPDVAAPRRTLRDSQQDAVREMAGGSARLASQLGQGGSGLGGFAGPRSSGGGFSGGAGRTRRVPEAGSRTPSTEPLTRNSRLPAIRGYGKQLHQETLEGARREAGG